LSPDGRTGFGNFVFTYATLHLGDFESYTTSFKGKTFLEFNRRGDLEAHCLEAIPDAVGELLALEGLDLDRVKAIFPPQISPAFLTNLAAALAVSRDRLVDIAEPGKDYFTSSIGWSMRHALDTGRVGHGDVGLIISVAAGVQVGCAVYYF
jgi:3-oxoacyl-[acyl-carrier-protein] synthase III